MTHRGAEDGTREEAEQGERKKREETGKKSCSGESQSGVSLLAKRLEATRQKQRQPGAVAPPLFSFSLFYRLNFIVFILLLLLYLLRLHLHLLFCEPHDLRLSAFSFLSSSYKSFFSSFNIFFFFHIIPLSNILLFFLFLFIYYPFIHHYAFLLFPLPPSPTDSYNVLH